ncbi:ATP-binding protein [Sphaerisporangium sp. TRM90804]|uniref:ATP-binding protein n=1 Tax=Sphaerisporangium sp. TRM90804 TaxID=3031113 RepID=UPI002446959E|nr:ATP-binding protein [Sphaerisporangium sp. TRM90804]MDH2424684.1 ATP-binding protein [Sphaerisporangium sp. TRM90804]
MHSTDLTRGQSQWSAFDWWPPVGWWPQPARDLAPPGAGTSSATFVLAPRAESVHAARSFASGSLIGWGMGEAAGDMELVVSELATNALRHGLVLDPRNLRRSGAEPIRMSMIRRGPLAACVFADPGSAAPVMRHPQPLEPGGMGLHIVESLSVRWGWNPLTPCGKLVWAVLRG